MVDKNITIVTHRIIRAGLGLGVPFKILTTIKNLKIGPNCRFWLWYNVIFQNVLTTYQSVVGITKRLCQPFNFDLWDLGACPLACPKIRFCPLIAKSFQHGMWIGKRSPQNDFQNYRPITGCERSFFVFNGDFNGEMAKNHFLAIKSSRSVLQPSSYHCWATFL